MNTITDLTESAIPVTRIPFMSISDNRLDDLAGHQTSEVEFSRRAYRKRQQRMVITSLITIVLAAIIVGWMSPVVAGQGDVLLLNTSQHHCLKYWLWLNVKVLVVARSA